MCNFSDLNEMSQCNFWCASIFSCELIAIGNGTACRDTEAWIASLIARNAFHSKSIQYCIVSENGASIYSCGPIAKKEFPNMDVNLISAASIARRLSDPLAELVKIEPKHLGVGMYQHDISEKSLMESLNEVVTECVSFVGVDINTASVVILKYGIRTFIFLFFFCLLDEHIY